MIIALNGSPRKNKNTATLLNQALEGAGEAGARTELVHLYDLNYKGCVSCFACKRKGGKQGHCAMRDDLSPLLERLREVDSIILGSPIYYWDLTACMRAFLERFFFSNMLYNKENRWLYPKKTPSAFIMTWGITEEFMFPKLERFREMERNLGDMLKTPALFLHSTNAWQFDDYSGYETDIFDVADKKRHREQVFPRDCASARALGARLVPAK